MAYQRKRALERPSRPPTAEAPARPGMHQSLPMNRKSSQQGTPRPDSARLPFDGFTGPSADEAGVDAEKKPRHGFMSLAPAQKRNFLLLCLLYFLQGAPMGFVGAAIPLLPEFRTDYSKLGVLSLAMYPYSLKLFWSPIVDALWSPRLGRRKSWIVPVQTLSGLGLLWLGSNISDMIAAVHDGGEAGIWGFTAWWIMLVLMCATQDIAVDGWAVSLFSGDTSSYAATAQTVGLTAGTFLCSTVFISFNSADFANRWFRTIPLDSGLISLGTALQATGWVYLLVTVGLVLFKQEDRDDEETTVAQAYRVMVDIWSLREVRTLMGVHLVAKVAFIANDTVTTLKLREKGMSADDVAMMMLIDFPVEIALGYYAGEWSQAQSPMVLWSYAFVGRLGASVLAQAVVALFPAGGVTVAYLLLAIGQNLLSMAMQTLMFVAMSALHTRISDKRYGGIYTTLLATVSNLGGTFPRYFVLKSIDLFTVAACEAPAGAAGQLVKSLAGNEIGCVYEEEKKACAAAGGVCTIYRDGYNWVNIVLVVVGAVAFARWIGPTVRRLQDAKDSAWRPPSWGPP